MSTTPSPPPQVDECVDCGVVYVAITDADGDFLRYEIDIVSLSLERADGAIVQALPVTTRINFAEYVDLTEFVTVATIPSGVYVGATMNLDYRDASVFVERDGDGVAAEVRGTDGSPLETAQARLRLEGARALRVRPGLPAWVTLDFDLAMSNSVDLSAVVPVVTAEPFLVADPDLLDEKDRRLRGPLVSVDLASETYRVAIRPFRHAGRHDFGVVMVHTDSNTSYEIDGESYTGLGGLEALEASGTGTPTVTFGTVDRTRRHFLAREVHAGSSVPGEHLDGARGYVIARDGDHLDLHGVLVETTDGGLAFYRNRVSVLLGPDTRVWKRGESVDRSALSPGQRVQVLGAIPEEEADVPVIEASLVRMTPSWLAGTVNLAQPGYLTMDLQWIGGRRPGIFDFSGTGLSGDLDADPGDYEINTGDLDTSALGIGTPARSSGYPRPFGTAPDDFDALSITDLTDVRARLGFGWAGGGSSAPFLDIGPDGLVIDPAAAEIGERHHVLRAGVVTDALATGIPPTVSPRDGTPGIFALSEGDQVVRVFFDFAEFADALAQSVDGSQRVTALHASGRWDDEEARMTAKRVAVRLAR